MKMSEIWTFEQIIVWLSDTNCCPKTEQNHLVFGHFRNPNDLSTKQKWSVRNPNAYISFFIQKCITAFSLSFTSIPFQKTLTMTRRANPTTHAGSWLTSSTLGTQARSRGPVVGARAAPNKSLKGAQICMHMCAFKCAYLRPLAVKFFSSLI